MDEIHRTDPDAAGCRRLHAAVLGRALDDLQTALSDDSAVSGGPRNSEAVILDLAE